MKTTLWRWTNLTVVVGFAIAALIIAVLTMELAKADPLGSSGLGSEWKCRRLPMMVVCDHIVQRKSFP
jgi:hypothetical protein